MNKALLICLGCIIFSSFSLTAQEIDEVDELYFIRRELADSLFPDNINEWKPIKDAFLKVRRELFIDENYRSVAYKNMPIPGKGGLIQPSPELIANILKESDLSLQSKVLVIGRNTQYLDSLISELTVNLYVSDLSAKFSPDSIINVKNGTSYYGWIEAAPFDVIILFGYVEEIPQSLVSQLVINGKIIAPVSFDSGSQLLLSATRFANGFEIKSIGDSYIHPLK